MGDVKPRNRALRLLGIPVLPRKLPSRNWLIFWAVSGTFTAALVYDRREQRRATARWAAAVAPLAREPLPDPSAMPRRLTVYLEAPPGDGLRVAQDHFTSYVKPVLASSGLDWEFAVGRREGDVRAVVAEKIRRARRRAAQLADDPPTDDDVVEAMRKKAGIAEYDGVRGDVVVGRHTWKEYVRGLHEGWLGPLAPPPSPDEPTEPPSPDADSSPEKEKPKVPPPQPQPYNAPEQYPSSPLAPSAPAELAPAVTIPFPHILGIVNTPTRFHRFLTRRYLADDVGRQVAAACFCTYREFRDDADRPELSAALAHEERDWSKAVWKEEPPPPKADGEAKDGDEPTKPPEPKERIWASPVVLDSRIAVRMRRFELQPDDEAQARRIVVPEEQVEGWTKGKLRELWRWGGRKWKGDEFKPKVGSIDDAD